MPPRTMGDVASSRRGSRRGEWEVDEEAGLGALLGLARLESLVEEEAATERFPFALSAEGGASLVSGLGMGAHEESASRSCVLYQVSRRRE